MPPPARRVAPPNPPDPLWATARALHAGMIHLLRRLRRSDETSGVGPAQLSALSVLVFGGPQTLGTLARIEQVRPPTMTRIVAALERDGFVTRAPHPSDRRASVVRATTSGRRLMVIGRDRRLRQLAAALGALSVADRDLLHRAAPLLERLAG